MRTTRRTLTALSVVAAGVVGVQTFGGSGAVAQSRAANRWLHDPAAATPRSSASAAASDSHEGDGRMIVLNELFGHKFTFVDVGEPGDSPGDYGVFQDPLAVPSSGRRVGVIDVQCVEAYASHCRGAITLADRGQIAFDGAVPTRVDPDVFAVTGGTGEFVGVGGTLTVSFPSDHFARLRIELVGDR
jgi:hypothetical protein